MGASLCRFTACRPRSREHLLPTITKVNSVVVAHQSGTLHRWPRTKSPSSSLTPGTRRSHRRRVPGVRSNGVSHLAPGQITTITRYVDDHNRMVTIDSQPNHHSIHFIKCYIHLNKQFSELYTCKQDSQRTNQRNESKVINKRFSCQALVNN